MRDRSREESTDRGTSGEACARTDSNLTDQQFYQRGKGMGEFYVVFSHVTQGSDLNKAQLEKQPRSWPISSDRCEKIGQENTRGTGLC